jgi:hypothetical protein
MMKKGRPRSARPSVDRGTPELQARRARLVGQQDQSLASYPLGVLLANGDVGEDAHQAACRYAWLYGFVFGRTGPAARAWMDAPGECPREFPESLEAEIESDFRAAAGILAKRPAGKRALEDLVIFNAEPRWMRPVAPGLADVTAARLFHEALGSLTNHFRRDGTRASESAAREFLLTGEE